MSEHRVSPTTATAVLAELFERNPSLVGVIVADEHELLGIVARSRLLERLSQPFALELYLKRPVRMMHDVIDSDPDIMDARHRHPGGRTCRSLSADRAGLRAGRHQDE